MVAVSWTVELAHVELKFKWSPPEHKRISRLSPTADRFSTLKLNWRNRDHVGEKLSLNRGLNRHNYGAVPRFEAPVGLWMSGQLSGMYGPPLRRKQKLSMTG